MAFAALTVHSKDKEAEATQRFSYRPTDLWVLTLVLATAAMVASAPSAHALRTAGGSSPLATVTGTVTTGDRITLPSDATVSVSIVDVFLPDAPATISEQVISPAGQVPIPFRVAYDPSAIDAKHP